MGEYANIKYKKFKKGILRWLENRDGVRIESGGKHNIKVSCIHTGNLYPIPKDHNEINKHIVKDFMKWLVKNEICTEEEFDERIK